MKKGRFSTEEQTFIEAHAERFSPEQIATHLDRDPSSIRNWIESNVGFSTSQKQELVVANELRSKPYYKELNKQFDAEELEMFQFHFKKMWSQFKDDVFHTEEMQIVDTIKLEILMNRVLRGQNENVSEISDLENLVAAEKRLPKDERDHDYLSLIHI